VIEQQYGDLNNGGEYAVDKFGHEEKLPSVSLESVCVFTKTDPSCSDELRHGKFPSMQTVMKDGDS
jgi:hypothetical protein